MIRELSLVVLTTHLYDQPLTPKLYHRALGKLKKNIHLYLKIPLIYVCNKSDWIALTSS